MPCHTGLKSKSPQSRNALVLLVVQLQVQHGPGDLAGSDLLHHLEAAVSVPGVVAAAGDLGGGGQVGEGVYPSSCRESRGRCVNLVRLGHGINQVRPGLGGYGGGSGQFF